MAIDRRFVALTAALCVATFGGVLALTAPHRPRGAPSPAATATPAAAIAAAPPAGTSDAPGRPAVAATPAAADAPPPPGLAGAVRTVHDGDMMR